MVAGNLGLMLLAQELGVLMRRVSETRRSEPTHQGPQTMVPTLNMKYSFYYLLFYLVS
jgi:hypothetical protein